VAHLQPFQKLQLEVEQALVYLAAISLASLAGNHLFASPEAAYARQSKLPVYDFLGSLEVYRNWASLIQQIVV